MRSRIEHFGCRSCGGTLGVKEGQKVVTCSSCGTRNLIEIEGHIPRFMLSPLITLDQAKRRAMKLLKEKGLAPDLAQNSKFYDAGLYYLPHFEMTGVRTGKMLQTDIKKIKDGFGGERIKESSRATILMSDVYFSSPAAKLGDWGIESVPLEKQRQAQVLSPLDPKILEKDAVIFDPDITPENFEEQRKSYEGYLPGDQTKIVQRTSRIIYSPVWLIKYTYHDRLYRIVIDAVLGTVLFARAPKSDSDRIPLMLVTVFMLTYPLARAARFIVTQPFNINAEQAVMTGYLLAIPALILLSIGLVVVAMVWNQFRYSMEMVIRGDDRQEEHINKPPETEIEKAARVLTSMIGKGVEEAARVRANRWYG